MTCDSREHAIREMAYAKWEEAGCPPGDGAHFWIEAEKEFQTTLGAGIPSDVPPPKASTLTSFRAADPPPLKLKKAAGQSRKKAG